MIPISDIKGYIHGLEKRGWRLGLDRIKAACAELQNPQFTYPVVIVAGTNGKGSSACMLQKLARAHGFHTGLYTSPSLKSFNERIVVDGETPDGPVFDKLAFGLRDTAEKHLLSQFEFLTLMAFEYFRDKRVELAVVEVGMGGRLDATNAADATTAVITPIGVDHTEHLGNDLAAIATEKCGVLRQNATVICAHQDDIAMEVIGRRSAELGANLVCAGKGFNCKRHPPAAFSAPEMFDYEEDGLRLASMELGLKGVFQPANASLALAALSVLSRRFKFKINEKAVREALSTVYWPARFEVLPGTPPVVIDGAHNPHGASALAETLRERLQGGKVVFVFGALADKDYRAVIGLLAPLAEEAIVTKVDSPRALDPAALKKTWESHGVKTRAIMDPEVALELARERADLKNGIPVVVCGSLYLVGRYLDSGWKL